MFLKLIANAPASLDTLNVFAAALADAVTFASTILNILNNEVVKSTAHTKSEANYSFIAKATHPPLTRRQL